MNITEDEIRKLSNTKSESEWNDICDEIKKVRHGIYPPDWWNRVMMSGLAGKAQKNWK